MSKQDALILVGTVREVLPNTRFKVELDEPAGHIILAYVSGKMRLHNIKVMPGDRVKVGMSPYDLSKGRIVYRGDDV